VEKYNETEHTITGFALKYLLEDTDVTILLNELKQKTMRDNWLKDKETALKNILKSYDYNKKLLFYKNRKYFEFNVRDLVFVENSNKLNRKKLDELRIGPYKIMEKLSNSIYRINMGHKKSESNLFHITKLISVPKKQRKRYNE